jgi:Tol biopolymer transport system component
MTSERWIKVKEIFADAIEHAADERPRFVEEAACGDAELVNEVHRMITESERETGLLSRPALVFARGSGDSSPRFPECSVLARRFRIVRFIAHGGMGEVYEAEDLELGDRVALKTIRPGAAPNEDLLALLKKEIQLARRVTHPNVCRSYDLAQHEDPDTGRTTTLLSMELLEGHTLAEHLHNQGPFPWRDALPLIEQIGAGIQAAQDAGIIHGDLKPANIMLAPGPGPRGLRAVVMDFGVALTAGQARDGGRRGGTPGYLAPEQADGRPITAASDVYAFALIIVEMLGAEHRPGFKPELARMPIGWARILERCLDPDPARRYTGAAAVVKLLRSSMKSRWHSVLQVAAVLAVVAVGVALAKRQWTAGNPVLQQLFTEAAGEYVWSVSPDGRAISETLWDTGDLAIRDVASGRVRRITHTSGLPGAWGAVFSPDSHHLVYRWNRSRTDAELRIIGTDGKGERLLYKDAVPRYMVPLDWSPDGKRILVQFDRSLATISAVDGSSSMLTGMKPASLGRAMFAPDGSIVFNVAQQASKESLFDIHRISLNGVEASLVEHPANDKLIGWSPDHRKLIFLSDRSGKYSIWAVNVSDRGPEGEPQELRPGAGEVEPLGISKDGSLFYRLEAQTANVYMAALDLTAGKLVSAPKPIVTRFNGPYEYPDWSDDGARLVFSSRQDVRNPELLIHSLQDGTTRKIPVNLSYVWRPQWYAHSEAVVALGMTKDGQEGHFRIDPTTGDVRPLISFDDAGGRTFEGVWSADGTTMFNRYADWKRGLFSLNVKTRERKILYVPPAGVDLGTENLALSPDGRTLAFHARNDTAGTGTLMLLSTDTSEARPLLTVQRPEAFLYGAFTWTPDSKQILASRTKNAISEIWRVPVDGSTPAKIEFPPMRAISLRLNRDGKTIAFTNVQNRAEIWAFERFLK